MFPKISLTETNSWQELKNHYEKEMKPVHLRSLFQETPDRFRQFSFSTENMVIDFSKNLIRPETIVLLLQLAEECKVNEAINAMYSGEVINETENRQVLHIALRNISNEPVYVNKEDVMPEVNKVLGQIKNFCSSIHSSEWRGYSGKK